MQLFARSNQTHRIVATQALVAPGRFVVSRKRFVGGGLIAYSRRRRRQIEAARSRRTPPGAVVMLSVLVGLALMLALGAALAATSPDTDFQATSDQLVSWTRGTLGAVLRTAMFLVGMAIGVVTQRIMVPLFSTMVLFFAPAVVDAIFGALV